MKRTAARNGICIPLAFMTATCLLVPEATATPPVETVSPGRVVEVNGNSQCDAPGPCDFDTLVDVAQTDPCEASRYEAVIAIGRNLKNELVCTATVVCRPSSRRGLLRRALSHLFGVKRHTVQYVYVATGPVGNEPGEPTCCDRETREALNSIATGVDRDGQPLEPSPRVRQAAAVALAVCEGLGNCNEDDLPQEPDGSRGHEPVPAEPFEIEEPPAGSAGFEPLASSRPPGTVPH